MKTIYETTVTGIGPEAALFQDEQMLIIFNDNVPKDLADIAYVHTEASLNGTVETGDILLFDGESYRVTFVGAKVNETLDELGHCTIAFNGDSHADLPGTLCVEAKPMPTISVSTTIKINKAGEA